MDHILKANENFELTKCPFSIGYLKLSNIFTFVCRVIKMSSPNINNIMVCGCIVTYTCVICDGLDRGVLTEDADDTKESLLADEDFLRMLSLPPTPDRDCHTAQVHPHLYEGMTSEETMDAWAMMVLGQQELRQFIAQAAVDDQRAADEAERLTERFRELGEKAWIIGSVCEGDGVQIHP